MPAISITLRNWISPQEPRVLGRFSADTRLPVSWRSAADALVQLAHHARQFALGLLALALQAPDLVLDPAELLVDGAHQPLELLGALGHLAGRALLLGAALVGEAAARASRRSA